MVLYSTENKFLFLLHIYFVYRFTPLSSEICHRQFVCLLEGCTDLYLTQIRNLYKGCSVRLTNKLTTECTPYVLKYADV